MKEAFRLYRKYWPLLIGMAFIQQTLAFFVSTLSAALSKWFVLSYSVANVFPMLVYPLTLGMFLVYLKIWRGSPASLGDYLHFCHKDRLLPAFKLGFCVTALQIICNLPAVLLGAILPDIPPSYTIRSWVAFLLALVGLWVSFRLLLAPYLFIDNCTTPISGSYIRMGGRVLRAVGFSILLYLMAIPLLLAATLVLSIIKSDFAYITIGVANPVVIRLTQILFIPFAGVAMTGYACNIMKDNTPQYPPHNKLGIKDIYHK